MNQKRIKVTKNSGSYGVDEDEPSFICRLLFSSYSVFVDLSGWSSILPVKLWDINLNSTTCFANLMQHNSRKLHPIAKDWLHSMTPKTIREASTYIGFNDNRNITAVLIVQVVAKYKVGVVLKNQRILIIPTLVVADSSGFCLLTSMNEGLKVVYNSLDIGDVLFLTRFQTLLPRIPFHKGLFSDKHFVNLEIKLQFHSARQHYQFKFDPEKKTISPYFIMPEILFDQHFKFLMPNDLQMHGGSDWNDNYFDLVGIISYVGRIERFRIGDAMTVESVDKKLISMDKFILYRWITVVDKLSRPLPVRMFILNQVMEYQSAIIPGAHIVISNCIVKNDQYTTCKYISTSDFSHIFIGEKLVTYFRQRPEAIWKKASSILNKQNYETVICREDIIFCTGGTIHAPRVDESKFKAFYYQKLNALYKEINPSMKRRESRYLYIKGLIGRAYVVSSKDQDTHLRYKSIYKDKQLTRPTEPDGATSFHPVVQTWYSFVRKLPRINSDVLSQPTSREMCSRVTMEYARYCNLLLAPATLNDHGDVDDFTNLPCVDGIPHVEIDVLNESKTTEWRCVWKQEGWSIEEKVSKIRSAESKIVICLIEIFCLDNNSPLEVSLVDFVID